MSTASLEAELSRLKSINYELRNQLSEIEYAASNSYQRLESTNQEVQNRLNASAQKLVDSHQRGIAAIELQGEIDKMYTRFKQMELANKKIRECNNKKYYDFRNYHTIRKMVQGMMDNLDVNMVSDAVIYKSVEAEHLKTPDYWLTCVLLAIMAWKNDDKDLASRAIDIAIRLDKKNSSVFFMLFNLRMNRSEAALKWFYTYQECPLKGSDQRTFLLLFALMNKTINSSENMDDAAREEIRSFINRVIESNMRSEDYSEEAMVARAQRYYDRMDSREESGYPLLRSHCGAFPTLNAALKRAKGNVEILEFLKKTIHVDTIQRNNFVKNFINELVEQVNPAEQQIYDDIRYNELIIQYKGDVEAAKASYQATQQHDAAELNLIAEMIDWTFMDDEEELDAQGKQNMLMLTKNIHAQAIDRHVESYRAVDKTHLPIQIGEYSSVAELGIPGREEEKVAQFYTQRKDAAVAEIKNTGAFIGFGVAAAAAVGAFFVGLFLLAVALMGIIYGVVVLLSNKSKIKQLELQCANNIQSTNEVIAQLREEFRAYLMELAQFDQYVNPIHDELAQI